MSHSRSLLLLVISLFTVGVAGPREAATAEKPWESLSFLIGDWEAVGPDVTSQSSGRVSFALDLQGKVLVRKNHAELPAIGGRSSTIHDDLMVIYSDDTSKAIRAVYFDNEGHIIHYAAQVSADGRSVTFVSESVPRRPRYRLSYKSKDRDTISSKFEIAPAGKPEGFATYLEGAIHRKSGTKHGDFMNEQDRRESAMFQGTWIPVVAELAGQPFPDAIVKTIELILTKEEYTARVSGQVDSGTYRVDSTQNPPSMDITGTEGPNRGRTIPAICKLEGETLTICYDLSGANRPTEFKTKPDTQLFLVTYQRKRQ